MRVASSRLAWRIARAIVAREQGWSLDVISISRRWRFQVGSSRWIAQAYVSFFFHDWARRNPGSVVYAIHFEGAGSASALESSTLVQELRSRLGKHHQSNDGKMLAWKWAGESRPRRLLAEMDRISQAFGTNDSHRVPPTRSRAVGKRLAIIADVVLAHGTWTLETPGVGIWRDEVFASISPMPSSAQSRPEQYSQLAFFPDAPSRSVTASVTRAEAHGYVDHAGKAPPPTLGKLQPLSLRAALTEARFIETEVATLRSAP